MRPSRFVIERILQCLVDAESDAILQLLVLISLFRQIANKNPGNTKENMTQ
jgi:hypothetical protein